MSHQVNGKLLSVEGMDKVAVAVGVLIYIGGVPSPLLFLFWFSLRVGSVTCGSSVLWDSCCSRVCDRWVVGLG